MANKDSKNYKTPISYDLVESVPSSSSSESDTTEIISRVSSVNSFLSENEEDNEEINNKTNYTEPETTKAGGENVEAIQSSEEVECTVKFHQSILGYFQSHDFPNSFDSFTEECQRNGFPVLLPVDETSTKLRSKPKFTKEDAEEMLKMFDASDGEILLTIWKKLIQSLEPDVNFLQETNINELTIFLQIFVASIALQNGEEQAQKEALDHLRKFHEENSEIFTKSKDCLPFFAFPFVPNPQKHEVFKVVFTEEWRSKLREKVEKIAKTESESQNESEPFTQGNSDLYEMYKYCCSLEEFKFASYGFNQETIVHKLQALRKRKNKYKALFLQAQDHYHKLIGGTVRIIEALRYKDIGEDYDMHGLRTYLEENLSDIFVDNNPTNESLIGEGDCTIDNSIRIYKSAPEDLDDSDDNEEFSFSMPIETKPIKYSAFKPKTNLSEPCPRPPGTYNVSPENSVILSSRSRNSSIDKMVPKLRTSNSSKKT